MTASAIAALLLVVLLAAVAALLRRGAPGRGAGDALVVAGRAPLARDTGVAVVRVGAETVLVGYGRDGVCLLARLGREGTP